MRGEGMAERVDRRHLVDACPADGGLDGLLQDRRGQMVPRRRDLPRRDRAGAGRWCARGGRALAAPSLRFRAGSVAAHHRAAGALARRRAAGAAGCLGDSGVGAGGCRRFGGSSGRRPPTIRWPLRRRRLSGFAARSPSGGTACPRPSGRFWPRASVVGKSPGVRAARIELAVHALFI